MNSGDNDPSAGSPTETLLRLIPSLSESTCTTSSIQEDTIWRTRRHTQSMGAAGGVYKR